MLNYIFTFSIDASTVSFVENKKTFLIHQIHAYSLVEDRQHFLIHHLFPLKKFGPAHYKSQFSKSLRF